MKKLLLATAATIGLTGVASAADLAVSAPVAVAPVDHWTGLYLGANIGGGVFNATIDDMNGALTKSSESFRKDTFTAGVTAGYNWQFASHGLLGIEGNVNWSNFKASQFDSKSTLDTKWGWFSTIRARAGIVHDRALFYVTGGVAFVDQKANGDMPGGNSCTIYNKGHCFHVSSTETGLAAGLGAEYAIGGGWTGKLEYLYVGLPRVDAPDQGEYYSQDDAARYGVTSDAHLVRFGLNYLFNGAAPVAGLASAADLAVSAPVAVAPVDSWTGLYVGANIGGGLVNATLDDKTAALTNSSENLRKGAFTAGATAGYNWQFARYGLLGIEGDVNWTNFKVSQSSNDWKYGAGSALDAKWSWFSTVRARAGIVYDRALFYVTGGVAFVNLKANGDDLGEHSCTIDEFGRCFHISSTKTGLAAGVGAEYAIGGGWTGKLEYLYVGLPRVDAHEEGQFFSQFDSTSHGVTSDAHLVRFGLNYLFNAGTSVAGVASAADLAVKAPTAVAPVDHWSGLYVGANIGGGLVNATLDDKYGSLTYSSENFRKGALTAGVTAGYNWQFARHGLLGIEGDVNWTNFKVSQTIYEWSSALDAKWSWLSTIRARAGIVHDRALFYATGGVAFVDQKANGDQLGDDSCTINKFGRCFHVSSTETGLAAGVGAEYAFGGGWTGNLEYLYINLPRVDAWDQGEVASQYEYARYAVTSDAHILRFGLNYLFNAGAPVVAKY